MSESITTLAPTELNLSNKAQRALYEAILTKAQRFLAKRLNAETIEDMV